MILEVAVLNVRTGSEAAFEAAFEQASPIIASMSGFISHQLQRCVEVPQERGRVPLAAVLGARLAEDQHRDLGQVVTGEDVDAAGSRQVGHGRGPVPVEAGAVRNADRALSAP